MEGSSDEIHKTNKDRLCKSHENDFVLYTDPDPEKITYDFYRRRFTDGLPIIPPTKKRVFKFFKFIDRDPGDVLAILPPGGGKATVEKIAINSVMAGCHPTFMPVVQHSLQAMSRSNFNLAGVNATTHPVAICAIINGPISTEIEINTGTGCLGPGYIANATIGRALRLCLLNIAGAVPGIGDHATMGSPAKHTFCFGEAENESPWEPLQLERGYKADISTTTVMAAEAPHNVNDHRSIKSEDLMDTIVHTASIAGSNNSHSPGELLVIMSPEHAHTLAGQGWDKNKVKKYIHQNAEVPVRLADRGGRKLDPKWINGENVRITRSPQDVVLVVAGGPGRHTMLAPGFGNSSQSVTLPITFKDGNIVHSLREYKTKK